MNTAIQVVALLGFVLAMAACGGVAYLLTRVQDDNDTRSKLRNLDLELADLGDRLSVWQRRDAARQRRGVPGDAGAVGPDGAVVQPGQLDPSARKRALRARAAQLNLPGMNR